jgi:hypothetical protein
VDESAPSRMISAAGPNPLRQARTDSESGYRRVIHGSAASQVVRGCLTSRARSSQHYDLGLRWAARPMINRLGEHGISRFSRMEIPYMHGVFDRAGSTNSSRYCCW